MLNFVKVLLVWAAVSMAIWERANNVLVFLIPLTALFFLDSLANGGWDTIKACHEWLMRLLAQPVVDRYESREENYRSIIRKLDEQLFNQKEIQSGQSIERVRGVLLPTEEREYYNITSYSGSLFYRDKYE